MSDSSPRRRSCPKPPCSAVRPPRRLSAAATSHPCSTSISTAASAAGRRSWPTPPPPISIPLPTTPTTRGRPMPTPSTATRGRCGRKPSMPTASSRSPSRQEPTTSRNMSTTLIRVMSRRRPRPSPRRFISSRNSVARCGTSATRQDWATTICTTARAPTPTTSTSSGRRSTLPGLSTSISPSAIATRFRSGSRVWPCSATPASGRTHVSGQ